MTQDGAGEAAMIEQCAWRESASGVRQLEWRPWLTAGCCKGLTEMVETTGLEMWLPAYELAGCTIAVNSPRPPYV